MSAIEVVSNQILLHEAYEAMLEIAVSRRHPLRHKLHNVPQLLN